jgi:hypothetical protein
MRGSTIQGFRTRAKADAEELLRALAFAEEAIVSSIERECEALRAGQMLAAQALDVRLSDAARLYIDSMRAARASLWTMEHVMPGVRATLEERRAAFSSLLKVELAVLAAERAAVAADAAAERKSAGARAGGRL